MDDFIGSRPEDADLQVASFFVGQRRSCVLNSVLAHASIRLLHRDAAVLDASVVHVGKKQRSDVLAVGIEDHVAGHTLIVLDAGQCVANPALVQSGAADRVQQNLHRIVGQSGEVIRLLVEARLEARIEVEPARVGARGIVGKNRLEAFRGRSGQLQQFVAAVPDRG